MKNIFYTYFSPFYSFIIIPLFIFGCQNNHKNNSDGDRTNDNDKLTQKYYVEGEKLYNKLCATCHKKEGKGFKSLYPPLQNSDYLIKNEKQLPCIIYYGMNKEITVNGRLYFHEMPPNYSLTIRQIAQIIIYVKGRFMNEKKWISLNIVHKEIQKCKHLEK